MQIGSAAHLRRAICRWQSTTHPVRRGKPQGEPAPGGCPHYFFSSFCSPIHSAR
jgi:hypothetical protein